MNPPVYCRKRGSLLRDFIDIGSCGTTVSANHPADQINFPGVSTGHFTLALLGRGITPIKTAHRSLATGHCINVGQVAWLIFSSADSIS